MRERFEQRNPLIAAVRTVAGRLSFGETGVNKILDLHRDRPSAVDSAVRCREALTQGRFRVTIDKQGTLHTPVSGCPREIRPYLLLDGEPVVEMDISGAHIVVLGRAYELARLRPYRLELAASEIEAERRAMVAQIESGDVYGDGPDRPQRKRELLTALNIEQKIARVMAITKDLLTERPILAAIVERVKSRDHRQLSWWLQRWVSDVVNPVVLALIEQGIPSMPIIDAILCRERDAGTVGLRLGQALYDATGVRAKVGGIVFEPSLKTEQPF